MRKGLTLLETMLVAAVMAALTTASVPLYQQLQSFYDLDTAAQTIAAAARSAARSAAHGTQDSRWGIHLQPGTLTLFKGTSYAARDTAYDSTFGISTALQMNGTTEYVFEKMSGRAVSQGSMTLTNSLQDTRTISINDFSLTY